MFRFKIRISDYSMVAVDEIKIKLPQGRGTESISIRKPEIQ
jgi:hypothetical protein